MIEHVDVNLIGDDQADGAIKAAIDKKVPSEREIRPVS